MWLIGSCNDWQHIKLLSTVCVEAERTIVCLMELSVERTS